MAGGPDFLALWPRPASFLRAVGQRLEQLSSHLRGGLWQCTLPERLWHVDRYWWPAGTRTIRRQTD